jgi:hypothetical protein
MVEPILDEGGQGVNRIPCRCKMGADGQWQIFIPATLPSGPGH